ncbi:TIGR02678 family protein [Sphaerisporangium corydalis]|uniref:TIGR02678 family protein n=1 Tax=Sphaerisporangium corydalis TaxID=1441875 RepID=A0ABV9EDK5_9ACTN|nr:TIGR02678 family protein [Sphaerisporangium corydalis]
MAEPWAAGDVASGDLGAYQDAVRLVLTTDLITAAHPRPGMLERVLPWADRLTRDLRELFGYTLVATTRQVRLIRLLDTLDPSRGRTFTSRAGKPFDRRRLAYLCLVLGSFQRSRVEISLADLVRLFGPVANSIEGLGFDPLVPGHKGAVVDVVGWLVARGALSLSDGSVEAWARGDDGDALYDIDHDICASLFQPARPVRHLTSAAGLLDGSSGSAERRARRLLLERPVVYYAGLDAATAAVLRREEVAENLARLTGLVVERRAEGVLLADPGGRFTDRAFPGRGGAVNRAAGLLIATIADLLEDPHHDLERVEPPAGAAAGEGLLARVDSALPRAGVVGDLAWSPPEPAPPPRREDRLVLIERPRLEAMMRELYDRFGAASFTGAWQQDPLGLLDAAVGLLADLSLLLPVPGGVLLLPAAVRYRNITLAIPAPPRGQLDLFDGKDSA